MDCRLLKFQLPSGNYIPFIGIGTFQLQGYTLIKDVINYALAAGYRHIDTAAVYGNEQDVGSALKELLPKYHLTREDIFITSKLSPRDQGESALKALETSVKNLNCGYLDLYLIHWPGASGIPTHHPNNSKLRAISWEKLVEGVRKGLVRDIGVSNYTTLHLDEILSRKDGILPAVNQVEWHPHYHDDDLRKYCEKHHIFLQAYSSLGGSNNTKLISDPTVLSISKKLNKSPAQVLLRWALQQNVGIIPKARSKEHIEANIHLNFIIPDEDVAKLNSLKINRKYAWDPKVIS